MSQKQSREAVQWFVINESDVAHDSETLQRWEEWRADPSNRAEYVRVMQLATDVLELPPPLASRRELQEEVAVSEGACN